MKKWFKDNQASIWIGSTASILIIWAYSTFATISMADSQVQAMKTYVDTKHSGVENELLHQRELLKGIDQRTIEIIKEMRRR